MPPPSARSRSSLLPYLLLALAALFWSGNFVVGRAVTARIPPVGLAFWRWTVALAILVPLARRSLATQWRTIAAAWKVLLPLGVLGVGNFNLFVAWGCSGPPPRTRSCSSPHARRSSWRCRS